MARTIFFTPVGHTDPMSFNRSGSSDEQNVFDASMIHIYRYYLPDFTYIYMTASIYEKEERDHRYTKAMSLLAESKGRTFEEGKDYKIFLSEVDEVKNVYNMDAFYDDYLRCFHRIMETEKLDFVQDKLLVNISSGTPAMKSALYVLKSMQNLPLELLQVTDPEWKRKSYPESEYDVSALFARNADQGGVSGYVANNRTVLVSNRNLNTMKMTNILKKLVEKYDYEAALELYSAFFEEDGYHGKKTQELRDILEFAVYRKRLRIKKIKYGEDSIAGLIRNKYAPLFSVDRKGCEIVEYAIRMKLYITEKDYVNAARAMTPLNTVLLEMIFQKLAGVEEKDYRDHESGLIHSSKVLKESLPLNIYSQFEKLHLVDSKGFLSPHKLGQLLETIIDRKEYELKDSIRKVAELERKLRNPVAHSMQSMNESIFLQCGVISKFDELYRCYEVLLEAAGHGERQINWNSYEDMNAEILERIGEVI